MKKPCSIAALAAACILSASALTACTVAEASTHGAQEADFRDNPEETSSRLDDILARGYIEVATEPSFAPNEFIDPSKTDGSQYVGADIELANYIADSLGVELRLKPMDFTSVLGSVTAGKCDLAISALAYTPERAETMNLSDAYYFGSEDPQKAYGLLIREEDADRIQKAEDLSDKVIAVQNGSIQEQLAAAQIPECRKYNRVSSANDAFLMVQTGRADAAAAALKMAGLYLESNPDCGLTILENFYFSVDESAQGTRIGIQKGEDELTNRINEIIGEVVEKGLYLQWYEEYREYAKKLGIQV